MTGNPHDTTATTRATGVATHGTPRVIPASIREDYPLLATALRAQTREHTVPCQLCGVDRTATGVRPRTLTWNTSALCDRHEQTLTDTTPATGQDSTPPSSTATANPDKFIETSCTSAHRTGPGLGRGAARVAVVLVATVSLLSAWAVAAYAQVPDFTPTQPTGGNELLKIGGMLKWIAIYGCSAAFFGGLCCLAGGRLLDHRGAHKIGIGLMFSSVGVAILSGTGVTLLNAFASGN